MSIIKLEKLKDLDIESLNKLEHSTSCTPWSKESLIKELSNPIAHYIVAKDNEKVIGYIGIWQVLNEGHITNIAVDNEYRRQGIATALMKKIFEICKNLKITSLFLEVRVSNTPAINFYKKFGFKEIAIRKKYYSNNQEDASVMNLENL